jgi:hypothetical protein
MATLSITEYNAIAADGFGRTIQAGQEPATAEQQVTFGASQQSAAFDGATRMVRLHTDTNCYLAFGPNPTAATSGGRYLGAGQIEFFGVKPGHKVAAVSA